ncbi:hypothetical protein M972_111464 [Acetivibrio thermocellus AD2]|jgi:hypothetical protein|uniref:Uncharacterized protein n=1 Tax=Acetivibrio thermocellus AD2 TaxID=1138384 RepID=A0AB36TFZ5_ACETH|nr:hypothetical protein [Acetivibrio thermocellus]ADU74462.1 hypothetical protein Clo1313_1399 [Acetivibrio thermocellus DSM 1313]ALX08405.1 hypothetical protein AD2_01412 [Acetivibrio thermocellus AD2]ANV76154.1 hypothetical protein LQRI_1413 [Acetivibrio thermocellus DSM 2360]EIC05611.1 hypothetical protein YSBL_0728 [Acetivibrio thermocellus YS]PFH02678.1 hypothetical protein M972_111464 [Acetivibrio thermocellus AD2]
MKKIFRKIFPLILACIIVTSVAVDALTFIGVSRVTLSDTQTSNTGSLVALWGTSGQGRLRARSENGLQVTAKAMRVRENWFDEELKTIVTNQTSWTSWTPYFDLKTVNVGYYARIEGSQSAKGQAEFEVYQL